jgi:uncharacterized protein (TIGR03435 family)
LRFHRDTKELAIYALTTAKNGPKLGQTKAAETLISPIKDTRNGFSFKHVSMPQLVEFLSRTGAQRDRLLEGLLIDETGLPGSFDFDLAWTPDTGQPNADDAANPSIFSALQEQLGLKLEAKKRTVAVLVIDHAEKVPTAN